MLARSVWSLGAPSVGHYLPGGAFSLDANPAPRRSIELPQARALHGMVTAISGLPHHPTVPMVTLAPWPDGLGWAAYLAVSEAARMTAGRTHEAHLFGRPCSVRCGPLMQLRAPVVSDTGPRDLEVRTTTPLVVRGNGRLNEHGRHGAGSRQRAQRVGGGALTSTVCSWMPRRVGVELAPDSTRMEVTAEHGRTRTVRLGGHLGAVVGWEGSMRVRTNAVGEWLLRCGVLLGVGARVGFGFGRIEVSRCR